MSTLARFGETRRSAYGFSRARRYYPKPNRNHCQATDPSPIGPAAYRQAKSVPASPLSLCRNAQQGWKHDARSLSFRVVALVGSRKNRSIVCLFPPCPYTFNQLNESIRAHFIRASFISSNVFLVAREIWLMYLNSWINSASRCL